MSDPVLKMFRDAGAVLEGHFLLTSGMHSPIYWEKFHILQHPVLTVSLCRMIAERFKDAGIEVVAGPTTGGIILAFETARQMGVRAIYAEKGEKGGRVFGRGLSLKPGERVLVVDDVLTTGGSVKDTIDLVHQRAGGKVVGIGVLVDRSSQGIDLGAPLFSCLRSETVAYRAEDCPLCRQGLPLTRLGGGGSSA